MDIIIKSFNRPYCLDRCLQSIYKFVIESDFTITIVDDGTPQRYLDKIQLKFPDVNILKSNYYQKKAAFVDGKSDVITTAIPIDFWIESIGKSSDYFLLLEDDIWFSAPFNLSEALELMTIENIQMLKLFWLSNSNLIANKNLKTNAIFTFSPYNLYTTNKYFYYCIFKFYRFKVRKILKFFKIYSLKKELQYYSIYSVAGAIFKKDYFLNLWKNHNSTIDEGLQIKNALCYLKKNPAVKNFGNSNIEVLKTSFLSSAYNGLSNNEFNMFAFNKIVNKAWLDNNFNVMQNFPNDFSVEQIEALLDKEKSPLVTIKAWENWVLQFKNQYLSFGCQIE